MPLLSLSQYIYKNFSENVHFGAFSLTKWKRWVRKGVEIPKKGVNTIYKTFVAKDIRILI